MELAAVLEAVNDALATHNKDTVGQSKSRNIDNNIPDRAAYISEYFAEHDILSTLLNVLR
jgi:hypothetical protein